MLNHDPLWLYRLNEEQLAREAEQRRMRREALAHRARERREQRQHATAGATDRPRRRAGTGGWLFALLLPARRG